MLKVLRRDSLGCGCSFTRPRAGGRRRRRGSPTRLASRASGTATSVSRYWILLARGGGSLEDLWAFNEEIVARAVAASTSLRPSRAWPRVDVSIADLVADYHAHTPTEAAQATARPALAEGCRRSRSRPQPTRLRRGLRTLAQQASQRLDARHPSRRSSAGRSIASTRLRQ